jgi:hypothetical protein
MSQNPTVPEDPAAAAKRERFEAVLRPMVSLDAGVRRRQMNALLRNVVTEGAKR